MKIAPKCLRCSLALQYFEINFQLTNMDYLDYQTLDNDTASLPQPALSIPVVSNLSQKYFGRVDSPSQLGQTVETTEDTTSSDQIDKYAAISIDLLKNVTVPTEESKSRLLTLSSRLLRVLNNPLTDTQIRDMFSNLEGLGSLEISKLIEPGVGGVISRKKLKSGFEGDLIKAHSSVLKEYQPIIAQLNRVEVSLKKLNDLNILVNERIDSNYAISHSFNGEATELYKNKKLLVLKKNLLSNFKQQYTLNEYEEFVLTSGDINDEFFTVLKKAEETVENCSVLLSVDNPQLGLKIISKLNLLTNKSIERLINFANKSLGNLYTISSKLSTLHKCLAYLRQHKLNYFNTVINTFVDSRLKTLVDDFIIQTSPGSKSGTSRPILASAHDPVRYIGDLLAYIHSVVVNESETIGSIFDNASVVETTNKVLRSISKPLKGKIDQIISIESKLNTIHAIYQLLELYAIMFGKHAPKSDLLISISQLISSCQLKISSIVKNRLVTIRNSNLAQLELSLDLQPPEWIISFYLDVLPILDETTLKSIMNLSIEDNENLLKTIVNEPIEIVYEHILKTDIFVKRDQLILKQNFLDVILSKILPILLLSDKALEINEMETSITEELISYQLDELLHGCKLYDFYNVVRMISPIDEFFDVAIYDPIKENKWFTKEYMLDVDAQIREYIPNALLDIQQSLLKLNAPLIVNEVVTESSVRFIMFYEKFGEIVVEFLGVGFVWSDLEVATLLGVEEVYDEKKKLSAGINGVSDSAMNSDASDGEA